MNFVTTFLLVKSSAAMLCSDDAFRSDPFQSYYDVWRLNKYPMYSGYISRPEAVQ